MGRDKERERRGLASYPGSQWEPGYEARRSGIEDAMILLLSLQGTLVRVHSTQTRDLIAEFRRGADTANIYW